MLTVNIYTDRNKTRELAGYSNRIHPAYGGGGLNFGSGSHGFASCEMPFIPMTLDEAYRVLDWPGLPWVEVSDYLAGVQWEGRLEGRRLVSGAESGVALTAFGAARAVGDAPYIALWSDTDIRNWRKGTDDDQSTYIPERWQMDNNNRLYMAMKNGEYFGSSGGGRGAWVYFAPSGGSRNIAEVTFDYDYTLPTNWRLIMAAYAVGWGSAATEWTQTGDGANHTGSATVTLSTAKPVITFECRNNTGAPVTYGSTTGTDYVKITNIRVKTTTSSTVLASSIAASLVAFINSINSDQLSSRTSLIEATSDDLQDELYDDVSPINILDRLALLHDYEWGVLYNQTLYFREKGSQGRTFEVDVVAIELEGDIGELINSAYAVYKDANGRLLRGAVSDDTESQEKWGLVRRAALPVNTTSSTQAAAHLAAFLADRADYALRATIVFDALYDANGGRRERYELRSSDTLILRNLPASAGPAVDNLRRMRLARVTYTAVPESVSVEPDVPVPTLVTLIARQEAGL